MVQDKYYNVIVEDLLLSAANTTTEERVDLPADFRTMTLVLIHEIWMWPTFGPIMPETDANYSMSCCLNWSTGVGFTQPILTEDCIASFQETYGANQTATIEGGPVVFSRGLQRWVFDKPIPVAQSQLYFVGASTGQAAESKFGLRICFTTKKVQQADWLEVMEARHGYSE